MSPSASMTSAPSADRFGPTAAIVSPSTRTSALGSSPRDGSWVRTMPLRISIRSATAMLPSRCCVPLVRSWVRRSLLRPSRRFLADRRAFVPQVRRDRREVRPAADRLGRGPDDVEIDLRLRQVQPHLVGKGRGSAGGPSPRGRGRTRRASRRARGTPPACTRRTARRPRCRRGRRRRALGRSPAASARTSPSASASFKPKITVLTASFIAAPDPSGPTWTIVFASGSRAGRARSRSSAVPPTMSVSWPDWASVTLPETGASRIPAAGRSRVGLERSDRVRGDGAEVDEDGAARALPRAGQPARGRRRGPRHRRRAS